MELWKDGPQFEQSEHFRLGTDSVLLADFVNIGARRRGIDLGCGSGILPLLLLTRSTALHMTGLELNPEAARVARENIAANALDRSFAHDVVAVMMSSAISAAAGMSSRPGSLTS